MKAKILALLIACSLIGSMMAPLFAQEDNPNVDEITVPEGTEFKLQLHTTLNSNTSKAGDRIMCTLIDPVAVEDRDVLSKGVRIDGHVGESRPAGRKGKGGLLTIVFDTVELPNGQKVAILGSLTEVFSSESGSDPNVGPEGELKGKGPNRKEQALLVVASRTRGGGGRHRHRHRSGSCGHHDGALSPQRQTGFSRCGLAGGHAPGSRRYPGDPFRRTIETKLHSNESG